MILGTRTYDNGVCNIPDDIPWKTIMVMAPPGYGKTSLTMNLIAQIGYNRKTIILDPKDEYGNIGMPNMMANELCRKVNHDTLQNFYLPISSMTQPSDWASLGFSSDNKPSKGAYLLSELARWTEIHNDDADRFQDLLDFLPASYRDEGELFNAFPMLTEEQARRCKTDIKIKEGITRNYPIIKRFFKGDFCLDKPFFLKAIKDGRVIRIVTTTLGDDYSVLQSRAYMGKLLQWLAESGLLEQTRPAVFVEEADGLAPADSNGVLPSSLLQLRRYTNKYRAKGVMMVYIFQGEEQLDYELRQVAGAYKIIGAVKGYDHVTKYLTWNREKNERTFALIQPDGRFQIFRPNVTPVRYAGYRDDLLRHGFIEKLKYFNPQKT